MKVLKDLYTAMQNNKTFFKIIMGDFNTEVGGGDKECLGAFGYGDRNERDEDLVNFAFARGFKIMDTFFDKKNQRRWTWRSPNYETFNEIDSIMADKHQIVKNVEVMN